ncbi:unnamed protein product [Rangifer tarandus platyrhynchus]|uniref:Uncharacterized protein n=1 Tax=Rangifer tarandus platyrhynchus TaxID=3082113 RepID=A0AC59ZUB9_RANTA
MRRWQLLDCFAFCLFAVSMRRATGLAASRESGWRRGCSPKHRQEGVWKLSQLLQGQLWVDSDSCYTTGGRGEDVWWGGLWEPKGGAKHPSKGTVCAREGRLPENGVQGTLGTQRGGQACATQPDAQTLGKGAPDAYHPADSRAPEPESPGHGCRG